MSEVVKMAAPSTSHLQNMLQRAVQSIQWTYSIYWKLCSQQRILVWGDGYYNGAIKTRKTVQPTEVSAEDASLHRSQQLRELYETLSAGETNQQARRPSAALSPEDLTESEWFYLMCFSYYFPPGVGLPGKAYAERLHVWLTGANEIDSQIFSRAILAKGARMQTVVCIPLLDGVVELGTTERVQEDLGFIQHITNFFIKSQEFQPNPPPPPPKPALSEHSTSNPPTISPAAYITMSPQLIDTKQIEGEENEEEDEVEAGPESNESHAPLDNIVSFPMFQDPHYLPQSPTQPTQLMQLDMSEDIRLGSPDDGSNNLESDSQMEHRHMMQLLQAEDSCRWQHMEEESHFDIVRPPLSSSGVPPLDEFAEEDSHYSQTVSAILQRQSSRCSDTSYIYPSSYSAFFKWSSSCSSAHNRLNGSSQRQLKYILSTVPLLHSKDGEETFQKPGDASISASASCLCKGTPQEELISANHVLAERRRREKLNERFMTLRSLIPFVTKMDKASILGDTIEYVKQLREKIRDLEARARQMEEAKRNQVKKKMRIEGGSSGGGKAEKVEARVEVSIIENDALVELHCSNRDGLLLDVMQMLRQLRVEITTVQSSTSKGNLAAELRAKVKENLKGKKATILEVKMAIHQIVSHR